jgi:hypothetical protein
MKKLILCFVVMAAITTACKKDSKTAATTPVANSTPTNPPATLYDGQLTLLHNRFLGLSIPSASFVTLVASFFNTPVSLTSIQTVTAINVGTVSVNSKVLKRDFSNPIGPIYIDSTFQIWGPPFALTATGTGSVNAFNFSYTQPYPKLGDTALVPNVITRSAGLTFTLGNITNTDSIAILIQAGNSLGIAKNVAVINNSAQFSFTAPQLLGALVNSTQGGITLNLLKNSSATTNNKNYIVTMEERYFKLNVVVN